MSADNGVYIQKIKDVYYVWEDFVSNEGPKPDKEKDKNFYFKEKALEYANELFKNDYFEYGIIFLEDIN